MTPTKKIRVRASKIERLSVFIEGDVWDTNMKVGQYHSSYDTDNELMGWLSDQYGTYQSRIVFGRCINPEDKWAVLVTFKRPRDYMEFTMRWFYEVESWSPGLMESSEV